MRNIVLVALTAMLCACSSTPAADIDALTADELRSASAAAQQPLPADAITLTELESWALSYVAEQNISNCLNEVPNSKFFDQVPEALLGGNWHEPWYGLVDVERAKLYGYQTSARDLAPPSQLKSPSSDIGCPTFPFDMHILTERVVIVNDRSITYGQEEAEAERAWQKCVDAHKPEGADSASRYNPQLYYKYGKSIKDEAIARKLAVVDAKCNVATQYYKYARQDIIKSQEALLKETSHVSDHIGLVTPQITAGHLTLINSKNSEFAAEQGFPDLVSALKEAQELRTRQPLD